jgi:gamma-glutamyltranspeptidase/glutathione hydrolase
VLDSDRQPVLTVGAAGGPKIITAVILAIVRYLDFEQSLHSAVGDPRFHHQWRPNAVQVEQKLAPEIVAGFQRRGHTVDVVGPGTGGRSQAVARDMSGKLLGTADPRGDGAAAGL